MSESGGESKAFQREAELHAEIERVRALLVELDSAQMKIPLGSAADVVKYERQVKALTNELLGLQTALRIQQTLMSLGHHARERQVVAGDERWKNYGYRPHTILTLGGQELVVFARYWATHDNRARKGKGMSIGLLLLGLCDGCTPALASEVAQLAAALNSYDDAQARLKAMCITLSIKRIAEIAYSFSQRARVQQQISGSGVPGSLKGRRVVISADGGRLRVRRKNRGRKPPKAAHGITPNGENRSCW